jgi:cupin superfamily acireductone dioxygenase involved in methionine salvage
MHGREKNAYKIVVRKPEWKRPLGRPRHRYKENIETVVKEVGYEGVDWINLAQDRDQWQAFMNTVRKHECL